MAIGMYPCWSRDGEKIYYESNDGLSVMDKNGENNKLVIPKNQFDCNSFGFKISPCGKKIVYQIENFYVLNLETLKENIIRR